MAKPNLWTDEGKNTNISQHENRVCGSMSYLGRLDDEGLSINKHGIKKDMLTIVESDTISLWHQDYSNTHEHWAQSQEP